MCAQCAATDRTAEEVAQQENAYWTARVARELDGIAANLKTLWCRKLYTEFVEQEVWRTDPKRLALKLERYLSPFQLLEDNLPGPDSVNPSSLLQLFTAEDMRRNESIFRFLRAIGITIPDLQQRRDDSEWRRIRTVLLSVDNPDHAALLDRFLRTRYGVGASVSPKTIRVALHAARGLLSLSRGPVPTQGEIDSYLRRVPGQRAALSAFVGLLKHGGEPVILAPRRQKKSKRNSRDLATCIAMIKQTSDYAQLRAAVVGTLLGLLGMPLSEVVQLPRSSLRTADDQFLFILNGNEIALDQRLRPGLKRYLAIRDRGEYSTFLFPGRDPHQSVSDAAITYHFAQWGISARRLATEARAFLRQAAVLSLA